MAIKASSQNAQADEKALQAVRNAVRFDPPPRYMQVPGSHYVAAEFIFDYEVKNNPIKSPIKMK